MSDIDIEAYGTARCIIEDVHLFGVDACNRTIYLHAYYDDFAEEEIGVDYRMANNFIKNITILNSVGNSNILIHQQSVGGDWNYGIAIYDALLTSPSTTTMVAHAWSRSMSSITIQACDNRVLMPNADFMVHLGSVYVGGPSKEVYNDIAECKKADEKMLRIYASRCTDGPFFKNYTKEEIIEYIREKMDQKLDWWLTAKEAVDYGFVDGILGTPRFETIAKIRKTKRNRKPI